MSQARKVCFRLFAAVEWLDLHKPDYPNSDCHQPRQSLRPLSMTCYRPTALAQWRLNRSGAAFMCIVSIQCCPLWQRCGCLSAPCYSRATAAARTHRLTLANSHLRMDKVCGEILTLPTLLGHKRCGWTADGHSKSRLSPMSIRKSQSAPNWSLYKKAKWRRRHGRV